MPTNEEIIEKILQIKRKGIPEFSIEEAKTMLKLAYNQGITDSVKLN